MAFRVPIGTSFTGCVTVILPFLVNLTLYTPFRLMLTRVNARVNGAAAESKAVSSYLAGDLLHASKRKDKQCPKTNCVGHWVLVEYA